MQSTVVTDKAGTVESRKLFPMGYLIVLYRIK